MSDAHSQHPKRHSKIVKRSIGHPYLVSGLIMLVIIGIMVVVSNYYATSYPMTNVTDLPRNSISGLFINIFNGYAERVSAGESLTSIRASANGNLEGAAIAMAVALAVLIAYLFQKGSDASLKSKWNLLGSFIGMLLLSQYIITGYLFATKGWYSTGVSFFFVDSILVISVFCIANVLLSYRKLLMEKDRRKMLMKLGMWVLIALLIIYPMFAVFGGLLLQNLGYYQYNPVFAPTYALHKAGLFMFAWLFLWSWISLEHRKWLSSKYWLSRFRGARATPRSEGPRMPERNTS